MQVLSVERLTKCFTLYNKPHQRLIALLWPQYGRSLEKFVAVQDISFTLSVGETMGIVGRNGAGKSTLLQMLSGTLTPTSGSIKTAGRVAALLELGAGFNPEFTGRENVYLNAAIYGLSSAEVDSRLAEILSFADIGDFIDQPIKVYSSGMFVRLAFAVVAHVDADLLIIDEALAVGDALFAQKCMRFLESFRKRGAIIFVSHDADAVTQLCSRAVWMKDGVAAMIGDAKSVIESYQQFLYEESQAGLQLVTNDGVNLQGLGTENNMSSLNWHDARSELLNYSNLRNDLQLYRFDPSSEAFGTTLISVEDAYFCDSESRRLSWVVGGAMTNLCVQFSASQSMDRLIVGFLIKNRLGQTLLGDNNLLFPQVLSSVKEGGTYLARFEYFMPYLPADEYVVTIGVATGTQTEHVQHCWIHDALVFSCRSSHVVHGLIGVPMVGFDLVRLDG